MRNKENLTASLAQQPTTTHVHEASRAGEYFALAAIGVGLCIVIFFFLCALFAFMGIEEPARVVATGVVFVGVGGGLLWIAAWGLSTIFSKFLDFLTQLNRDTWDGKARVEQAKLLTAQTSATGPRSNDEDNAMVSAALSALRVAYDNGGIYRGVSRPWSRNKALGYNVTGLKHDMAGRLGDWMTTEGLLTKDNQVNFYRFPTWNDAQRYLHGKYLAPILVNGNRPAPYREVTSTIDL